MKIQYPQTLTVKPQRPRRQIGLLAAGVLSLLAPMQVVKAQTVSTGKPVIARQTLLTALAKSDSRWAQAIDNLNKGVYPFQGLTPADIRAMACQDNGERPDDPQKFGPASMAAYLQPRTLTVETDDLTPIKDGEDADEAIMKRMAKSGTGSASVCRIIGDTAIALSAAHVTGKDYDGQQQEVSVVLPDGSNVPAQVLKADQITDNEVLVFKIPSGVTLKALPLATTLPKQGDMVWTLGSPMEMADTFVGGVVSQPLRYMPTMPGQQAGAVPDLVKIQITAPIAPGNSGGPVASNEGLQIGINDAILAAPGPQGMSLAIPGSIGFVNPLDSVALTAVAAELGLPTQDHIKLGVKPVSVQLRHLPRALEQLNARMNLYRQGMATVQVKLDAAKATKTVPDDFKPGKPGGHPIQTVDEFFDMLGNGSDAPQSTEADPGKPPTLEDYTTYLTQQIGAYQDALESLQSKQDIYQKGLTLAKANTTDPKANGIVVMAVLPNTLAEKAGIKPGDIITAIDGESVIAPMVEDERVRDMIINHLSWQPINITYLRGGQETTVTANADGFHQLWASINGK